MTRSNQIAGELARFPRGEPTWSVLGEPTAGKSAVLDGLHQRLTSDGTTRSILVRPPPRAYDAGHAALIDLVEGLGLTERALDVVRDPRAPWETKLNRVRTAMRREGRIVLLVDEPAAWSPRETYFRTFVHDALGSRIQRLRHRNRDSGAPTVPRPRLPPYLARSGERSARRS